MKKGLLAACLVLFTCSFLLGRVQNNPSLSTHPALSVQEKGKLLPPFSFVMSGGVKFDNRDLRNKWTLFFIGYTYCPDICPTTLVDLDRIYSKLTGQYHNIQIVFVSVDPNRDTADHLAEYVNYFNPNFKGVTSTHQQLFPFAQNLGLVYSIVDEGEDNQYYLIDHSASIVLINPLGEHHATFAAQINENGIAHVDMDLMVEDIHKIYQKWPQR